MPCICIFCRYKHFLIAEFKINLHVWKCRNNVFLNKRVENIFSVLNTTLFEEYFLYSERIVMRHFLII